MVVGDILHVADAFRVALGHGGIFLVPCKLIEIPEATLEETSLPCAVVAVSDGGPVGLEVDRCSELARLCYVGFGPFYGSVKLCGGEFDIFLHEPVGGTTCCEQQCESELYCIFH